MNIKILLNGFFVVVWLLLGATHSFAQGGPSVQFFASPTSVTHGQTYSLFWDSINASLCRTTNAWGSNVPAGTSLPVGGQASGSFPTGTTPGIRSFGLRCCTQTTCTIPPCPEICSPETIATVTLVGQTSSNRRIVLSPASITGVEGTSVNLTARLESCGGELGCAPVAGQQLNFQNLGGTALQFSVASAVTNSNGSVTVAATLPFAANGSFRVTTASGDARSDGPVEIILGPRSLFLEPNPLTVALNGQVQAILRVRNQVNQAVPNESFTISYGNSSPGAVTGPATITSNTSGAASLPLTGVVGGVGRFFVSTRGIFGGTQEIPVTVTSTAATANRSGVYWNPQESGHGLFVVQAGNTLVPAWYTYDTDGKPLWFLVSGATLQPDGSYSGGVFRYTGAPFNQAPANAVQTTTQVGTARLRFGAGDSVEFSYTINNQMQTRNMVKFDIAPTNPLSCVATNSPRNTASNYTDLWWNPDQQGWGLNLLHQGPTIFLAWYTFGFDLRPMWVSGLAQRQPSGSFTGTLNRPLTGTPWPQINGAPVTAQPIPTVGNFSINFSNGETGTFSWTLDGVTQTRNIRRFEFGAPATVCASG